MNIESELTATSALAERAKGLVPLLDENADQSDEDGVLSDAVVEALHDNSLFGMWVPEVVGGSELDPIRSLKVIANLSYGDPSVGWVVMASSLANGTGAAYLADARHRQHRLHDRLGVFVPESYTHFAITEAPLRGGDIYRMGIIGFAEICHSGWALGVGRRMLDELTALVQSKAGRAGAQADNAAFQQGFAKAEGTYRAARAFVDETWADVTETLDAGAPLSVRQHTLIRLALTHVTGSLHDVANFVYLAGGTTALRRGPIQRLLRDVHAGTQHMTSSPPVVQACGRELAGLADDQAWRFLELVDA